MFNLYEQLKKIKGIRHIDKSVCESASECFNDTDEINPKYLVEINCPENDNEIVIQSDWYDTPEQAIAWVKTLSFIDADNYYAALVVIFEDGDGDFDGVADLTNLIK